MDRPRTGVASRAALARIGRVAAVVVLVVAALDWVGWAACVEVLTRVYRAWPPMVPWTAVWLAGLASAILLQSGQPSRPRVWAGRSVAMVVSVLALVVLARQEDTVGRTGGDEVLVVLPGLRSIDQLTHISEKIRSRAAEPIQEAGKTIHATLSIGATIAVPGETVSSVIARPMQRGTEPSRATGTPSSWWNRASRRVLLRDNTFVVVLERISGATGPAAGLVWCGWWLWLEGLVPPPVGAFAGWPGARWNVEWGVGKDEHPGHRSNSAPPIKAANSSPPRRRSESWRK